MKWSYAILAFGTLLRRGSPQRKAMPDAHPHLLQVRRIPSRWRVLLHTAACRRWGYAFPLFLLSLPLSISLSSQRCCTFQVPPMVPVSISISLLIQRLFFTISMTYQRFSPPPGACAHMARRNVVWTDWASCSRSSSPHPWFHFHRHSSSILALRDAVCVCVCLCIYTHILMFLIHSPVRLVALTCTRVYIWSHMMVVACLCMCLCVIHLFVMSSSIHNQNKKNKEVILKSLLKGFLFTLAP